MTGHRGAVLSLCVMGRHLYSGSEDGYVFQWALQDGKKTDYIPMTRGVTCLSAYPQRQLLIAGDRNGRCAYWDCHSRATPHMVHEYYCKMQVEAATGKTCIPETRCLVLWYPWLFVAVGECVVEQRCLDDWKLVRSLEHPKAVLTATASLDVLFTGCADGVLRTWDIQTGAMLQRFIGHPPNRCTARPAARAPHSSPSTTQLGIELVLSGAADLQSISHHRWWRSLAIQTTRPFPCTISVLRVCSCGPVSAVAVVQ